MSDFRKPTKHNKKRRASWHNYNKAGTYMITLVNAGRAQLFGKLILKPKPHIELSPMGKVIAETEIKKINALYPNVRIWEYVIMPDHIHLIANVSSDFPKGKHLGKVIYGFKTGCTRAWWALSGLKLNPIYEPGGNPPGTVAPLLFLQPPAPRLSPQPSEPQPPAPRLSPQPPAPPSAPLPSEPQPPAPRLSPQPPAPPSAPLPSVPDQGATVPEGSPSGYLGSPSGSRGLPLLFEEGYHDGILMNDGQLDRWKRYLADNPRRLAIKRQYPDYFTVIHDLSIYDHKCQIVGNRFLLDIPDKMAVIVHRADTDADYYRLFKRCMSFGEAGGVLVSAAIAPREKFILREAMDRGYRIILLRDNGFPPLYKPGGEAFEACASGRLLQISPWDYHYDRRTITRSQCLHLNDLAIKLSSRQGI